MSLKDFLKKKETAIVKKWLESTFSSYPQDTAVFLGQNKDPFANPVGHALREGTSAIYKNLLDGFKPEDVRPYLKNIIKIKAIQDFSPSQALSFVLLLKKSIRTELAGEPELNAELVSLDNEIDRMALLAFDIYMECREQFYELRVNEMKRSVSGIMGRFSESGFETASEPILDKTESS